MNKQPTATDLDKILGRSDELDSALVELFKAVKYKTFDSNKKISASYAACKVEREHSRGVRILFANGLATSAICLMRPQYEAVTRAV